VIQERPSDVSPAPGAVQLSRPPQIPGLPLVQAEGDGFAAPFISQHAVIANIGQATTQHLRYAVDFHQAIPPRLEAAARDPLGAGALVCAFLLASAATIRAFRAVENQSMLAILAGKALWAELFKKNFRNTCYACKTPLLPQRLAPPQTCPWAFVCAPLGLLPLDSA